LGSGANAISVYISIPNDSAFSLYVDFLSDVDSGSYWETGVTFSGTNIHFATYDETTDNTSTDIPQSGFPFGVSKELKCELSSDQKTINVYWDGSLLHTLSRTDSPPVLQRAGFWYGDTDPASGSIDSISITAPISSPSFTPGAGSISIAGKTPAAVRGTPIAVPSGAVAFAGNAPSRYTSTVMAVGAGAIALSGKTPTVINPLRFYPDALNLYVTGQAPALANSSPTFYPGAASVTIAGQAPTSFRPSPVFMPGVASLVITPHTAFRQVSNTPTFIPGKRGVHLDGYAPAINISGAPTMRPGAATIAIAGQAPGLLRPLNAPDAGAISLAGRAPTLRQSATIVATDSLSVTDAATSSQVTPPPPGFNLPPFVQSGHNLKDDSVAGEIVYGLGDPRVRRTDVSSSQTVSGSWQFAADQYALFVDWYEHDLIVGTEEFFVDIINVDGTGVSSQRGVFLDPPEATTDDGLNFTVSAKILVGGRASDPVLLPSNAPPPYQIWLLDTFTTGIVYVVLLRDDFTGSGTLLGRTPDGAHLAGATWGNDNYYASVGSAAIGSITGGQVVGTGPFPSWGASIALENSPANVYIEARVLPSSGNTIGLGVRRAHPNSAESAIFVEFGCNAAGTMAYVNINYNGSYFLNPIPFPTGNFAVANPFSYVARVEVIGLSTDPSAKLRVKIDGLLVIQADIASTSTGGGAYIDAQSSTARMEYVEVGLLSSV